MAKVHTQTYVELEVDTDTGASRVLKQWTRVIRGEKIAKPQQATATVAAAEEEYVD
jgi:hypothetical protein